MPECVHAHKVSATNAAGLVKEEFKCRKIEENYEMIFFGGNSAFPRLM